VRRRRSARTPEPRGTAVVTGASSGIGAATVRLLAERGFHVIAGVRDLRDAEPLTEYSDRVEPIQLDITDAGAIAAFAERIGRLPDGLDALVNNAGTISVGPIELIEAERWEAVMRVNILGTINLTRAALPAVIRSRGRVINVSSPTGRIALPMFGPYAVSKFALEAFNDTLRREIGHLGVRVICVTPGPIVTPIFDKGLEEATSLLENSTQVSRDRYGAMAASALQAGEHTKHNGRTPEEAAAVIARALTTRRPRTRYSMGRENQLASLVSRAVPDRAADALIARMASHSDGL
jgi:NAD(P)-dependent dehydrogenase (short-subunit alcohol dehydrogenase family)